MGIERARRAGAIVALALLSSCNDAPRATTTSKPAKPTQKLELPGVRMQVPADYVKYEEGSDTAKHADGESTTLAMHAPAGLASGAVQIQRSSIAISPLPGVKTVRELLDSKMAAEKKILSAPPAELIRFDVMQMTDAMKYCAVARRPKEQDAAPLRQCHVSYVTPDQHLVSLVAVCIDASDEVCTTILASLDFSPEERLPFGEKLKQRTTTETQSLAVSGIEARVSALYEPLPPEELEKLKGAFAKPEASDVHDLSVLRSPPDLPSGMVMVERIVAPASMSKPTTVRELLDAQAERIEQRLTDNGADVIRKEITPKEDALEYCNVTRLALGADTFESRTCGALFVTKDRSAVILKVVCQAESRTADEVCGSVMSSRKLTLPERLAFTTKLE